MELSLEKRVEKVRDFRPIDDAFFEVLAQNKEVCQEMLRVFLEDAELIVNSVITQSSKKNLYGRSVRLDALCTLGSGIKCNIEVQRADNDNHLKRVRFNASTITVIDDGTDIADLMSCFMKKEVKNPKFPALTAEMTRLKETEGGVQAVCDVMKKYEDIAVRNERIEMVKKMIEKGYSKENIFDLGYTSEEYNEAKSQLVLEKMV